MAEPLEIPPLVGGGLSSPPAPSSGIPSYDFLAGMGASALGGVTELVGVTPPGAAEFRQDHPFLGFATQLASAAIPYTGWFKATKAIPAFDKAIRSIGNLEKSPFLAGAAREAARFAPFEAGRLGISQLVGDRPFSDMATDTALSLGLSAGIGGLVHGLAAAGTRAARKTIPGVDITAPAPLQLRKMQELALEGNLEPEVLARTNMRIKEFEILARNEKPSGREKYVADTGNKALTRILNSMFNADKKQITAVEHKPFISRTDPKYPGFDSEKRWKGAALEAGLPENFPALGRYFRHVSFKPTGRSEEVAKKVGTLFQDLQAGKITQEDFTKASQRLAQKDYAAQRAKVIDTQITEGMESLGDNYFMKREGPDGLFILAKKVRGVPGTGTAQDSWVVFKTDQPGKFLPSAEKWKNVILNKNAWHRGATELLDGGPIYNTVKGHRKHFPPQNMEVLAKPSRLRELLPKKLQGTSAEFAHRLAEEANYYLAPTAHQLKRSALGRSILQSATLAHETADTFAHEIVFGKRTIKEGKSLYHAAMRGGDALPTEDYFEALLKKLDDKELEAFRKLRNNEIEPELLPSMVLAGDITQNTSDVALRFEQLESLSFEVFEKQLTGLGEAPKKGTRFSYGIPKTWEGDTRIPLLDQAGAIRYAVGGASRKTAQENAKRLLKEFPELKQGEEFAFSQNQEVPKELKPTTHLLNNDTQLRGHKWDVQPWRREDLLKDILAGQQARAKLLAEKTIEDLTSRDMARLAASDPASYRVVESRLRDLAGVQSPGSLWQNKTIDRYLAPSLGTNSATKIVGLTNTGLFRWHLGMGDLSYGVLNMTGFLQTVVPEVAMILRTSPEDVARAGYTELYSLMAAGGTKGPVGVLGLLDPLKLMGSAFRAMRKPEPGLRKAADRGMGDGTLAPRMAEEYAGENAIKVGQLKEAFSSPQGVVKWLGALSDWIPANSEKLARMHTFTAGYLLAKNVMKIEDEEIIYRTAKKLTERTMFLYSSADRPRIFTTPAGSAMGLFKTWMMNYMALMMEYSGQAVRGNVAPLAWQTAGTAAVGGLAATPLYWIADGFSKAFTDDTLLQNTYNYLGESQGNAFMYGLPAALTGVSLYSQVSSPLANPARDASMLWSSATLNRMTDLGKSVGLAFDHWQATGEHPGRSDRVRDTVFKALAPSTISRVLQAFSGDGEIRSLGSGYPILRDVPFSDRVLYSLKLNPVELDKARQVQAELWSDQNKHRARVIELGTAFAEAQIEKNTEQMKLILRQALIWGLDTHSILRSATTRLAKREQDAVTQLSKPRDLAPYREVLK